MKDLTRNRILPLAVWAAALSLTFSAGIGGELAWAKHPKGKAAGAKPTLESISFNDAFPIVMTPLPKAPESCAKLKEAGQDTKKTAWMRGYDQAMSGQRFDRQLILGGVTLFNHKPCDEYKALGPLEKNPDLRCCYHAYKLGKKELDRHLDLCLNTDIKNAGPESDECVRAYNSGIAAAELMCNSPRGCPQMTEIDLKTAYPGCLARGFEAKLSNCKKANRAYRRYNRTVAGSIRTELRDSKLDPAIERFRAKLFGAGDASLQSEQCDEFGNPLFPHEH